MQERLRSAFAGAYTIERELGGGVMSRVFAGEETALGRRVAIKVLAPEVCSAMDADRFRHEVQVAARLQHPHIVPVLTAGDVEGMLYYTMPFIDGQSLRARMTRATPVPIEGVVCVVRDVAKALRCAHRRGVIHRDVKPENVLLHEGGDALVADFGIAKALSVSTNLVHTAAGFVLGTPAYISPEQASGDPATDHRADLYSLGLVAYELLAGGHPFAGRTPQAILTAQLLETPAPIGRRRPDAPHQLATLVMDLLEKRPADRPQSADEILQALTVRDDAPAFGAATGTGQSGAAWRRLLVAAATQAAADLAFVAPTAAALVPVVAESQRSQPTLSRRLQEFLTHSFQTYAGRRSRGA